MRSSLPGMCVICNKRIFFFIHPSDHLPRPPVRYSAASPRPALAKIGTVLHYVPPIEDDAIQNTIVETPEGYKPHCLAQVSFFLSSTKV